MSDPGHISLHVPFWWFDEATQTRLRNCENSEGSCSTVWTVFGRACPGIAKRPVVISASFRAQPGTVVSRASSRENGSGSVSRFSA